MVTEEYMDLIRRRFPHADQVNVTTGKWTSDRKDTPFLIQDGLCMMPHEGGLS